MKKIKKNSKEGFRQNDARDELSIAGQALALEAIIDETTSLFQILRVVAEEVHGFKKLSGGKRGVLRSLYTSEPQTVPQMARARPVSRQHIQTIVNPLIKEELVEFIENPAHKRSKLVRLTQKGVNLVEEMNRIEIELFSGLKIDVSEQELRNSASVLRSVRELFDSEQLKELLETIRTRREKK